MKGLHIAFGGIALLSLLPGLAYAGGESGLFIGGGIGQATLEADATDPSGGANFDFEGDDSAYKIILGYNFGVVPMLDLAVEGSYVDFGKIDGTSSGRAATTELTGYDAFGLVGANFGPFGLFGKAGMINWDSDAVLDGAPVSDSGTDPAYGVGVRMQLFSITLRGEYELFDLDNTGDLSMYSISALYTF